MFKALKNFIKTKPIIYDYLNSMRPISDDVSVWLDNFSKANNSKIKFVQVGANDGLRWDPLRRFILRDSWKGVLIEPIMPVYELLKANYSYASKCDLFFENCVISSGSGFADFWTYSNEFLESLSMEDRLYFLRKSSLDKDAVERSLIGFSNPEKKWYVAECLAYHLALLLKEHSRAIKWIWYLSMLKDTTTKLLEQLILKSVFLKLYFMSLITWEAETRK